MKRKDLILRGFYYHQFLLSKCYKHDRLIDFLVGVCAVDEPRMNQSGGARQYDFSICRYSECVCPSAGSATTIATIYTVCAVWMRDAIRATEWQSL